MILSFLLACGLSFVQLRSLIELPQSTEEVTRIYCIHNAESDYSVKDEQGTQCTKFTSGKSPAVHLNERGKEQPHRLAELMSSRLEEAVVFLPPAERAKETIAQLLSERIVLGRYYEELFEVGMGEWEGKPKDQAYKAEYQKWADLSAVDKYTTPKVSGGESYQEAANRALHALEGVLQSHPGKTILVVSGENLLNALAIHWLKPTLSQEPGSKLPLLAMEKGDFFRVEIAPSQEARIQTLFPIR